MRSQSLLFAAGPEVYEENELESRLDAVLVVVQHELTAGMGVVLRGGRWRGDERRRVYCGRHHVDCAKLSSGAAHMVSVRVGYCDHYQSLVLCQYCTCIIASLRSAPASAV